LAIALSVLLRFVVSIYTFGIFNIVLILLFLYPYGISKLNSFNTYPI